jgi:GcrA cell cycle regulator
MQWTAEAVEDLKRLALEGRSASVIAAALGAASRNAVIGKASRIGIKLSGGGRASARGKTPARAGRSRWAAIPPLPSAGERSCDAALDLDPRVIPGSQPGDPEESEAAWRLDEAEVGEMRRVRFEEIREFACRWPLGDPKTGEFAYCGLTPAKGQSYCAGHCRMAYRPPNAGARQRSSERQGFRALANPWRLF